MAVLVQAVMVSTARRDRRILVRFFTLFVDKKFGCKDTNIFYITLHVEIIDNR